MSEVRKRAGGASTEAAADAIAAFMEVNETSEESSNGWMLLSAINILSAEGEAINDVSFNLFINSKEKVIVGSS